MGDDLNDIDIIKSVGISSCPIDAIDDVKNVVDIICDKKGGDGCVREFIDYILKKSNKIFNTKKQIIDEFNYQINNFPDISYIVNKIKTNNGNIFFTGIGKSEDMSNHGCNLLKSIGLNSFSLNILNLTHGDMGSIQENDIIFFSKSGNTSEIINIIDCLKGYKIGVCCNQDSKFLNHVLDISFTIR